MQTFRKKMSGKIFFLTLFGVTLRFVAPAQDTVPTYIDRLGDNHFVAYISSNYNHLQSEEPDLIWQWAACVQSVLNIYELVISQREIVDTFNSLGSDSLSTRDFVNILDNWQIGTNKIRAKIDTVSIEMIKHNLALGRPIIVLYKKEDTILEPCILTAVFYHTADGLDVPEKIVVRHAVNPESDSRKEYSWDEFNLSFSNQLIHINF